MNERIGGAIDQDRKQQILVLERQCENQMAEFERNFNYSHSQFVLRSILADIERMSQELLQEEMENENSSEQQSNRVSVNTLELQILSQKLEARVYECIGTIYLNLSLSSQSLGVLERASNIMLRVQEQKQTLQNEIQDKIFQHHGNREDKINDQKDNKLIARILIKTSFALFLQSEQKSSYCLLRDAHTYLKQNELLDTDEEALLFYHFGNFYRFIFQDELSESCYQKCLSIREKLFGKDSPIVYDAKQELAKLYIESGQLSQAEQLIEEVMRYKTQHYGEQSPSTSVIYLYRANLLFVTSAKIDDALQDVLKSIQINTLYIGEYNKVNAECYILLGKILAKKLPVAANYANGNNCNYQFQWNSNNQLNVPFSWAQYKQNTINDPSSSPSSSSSSSKSSSKQSSFHTLTSTDYQTPNYLNLQQIKLNKFNSLPTLSENSMANLQYDSQTELILRQIYKTEESEIYMIYFNKALSILKTLFGEVNGCVGIAYNTIGKVLLSLKQFERALNCFNTAIEIYQIQQNTSQLSPYSQNYIDNSDEFNIQLYFAIKNAADCNMKLGRLKTAHVLYQQILAFKDTLNQIYFNQSNNSFIQKMPQSPPIQQENQLPFTLSFTPTTQSILLNTSSASSSQSSILTIEDEHKKLFVSPIDINPQQILQLLNQSRTED